MENLLSLILKKRGLELGQIFTWDFMGDNCVLKFENSGLYIKYYNSETWANANAYMFNFVSDFGDIKVVKEFPILGHVFYYVDERGIVCKKIFTKSSDNAYLLANGNYYSNGSKARENTCRHVQQLTKNLDYLYAKC